MNNQNSTNQENIEACECLTKCNDDNCHCAETVTAMGAVLAKPPASVISTFEIPADLASELNSLIPRVAILKDLMMSAIDSPARFDALEAKLIPLQDRYTTLKNAITYNFVPDKYRDNNYSWSYPGYEISGNTCWLERN